MTHWIYGLCFENGIAFSPGPLGDFSSLIFIQILEISLGDRTALVKRVWNSRNGIIEEPFSNGHLLSMVCFRKFLFDSKSILKEVIVWNCVNMDVVFYKVISFKKICMFWISY
jgi:hypothetical protein